MRVVALFPPGPRVAEHQGCEVQHDEAGRSEHAFEAGREKIERHQVEEQMRPVGMHEAARNDGRVLPIAQKPVRAEQAPLDDLRTSVQA